MMRKFGNKELIFFGIPFIFDRLFKYLLAAEYIKNQDVTSFLEIYVTYNRGISWGIGGSSDMYQYVALSLIVGMVILGFVWYMRTEKMNSKSYISCLLIMSGAVSNFIDRLWYGGVLDFIRFYWQSYSFPVFNIADVFISIGAVLLFYYNWFDE